MKRGFVFGAAVFLFSLLFFVHILPERNPDCKLSVSNFSTDCLSSIPYSSNWPTTAVRISGGGFVFFSEGYVYETEDSEIIPPFLNGEKSSWTRKLGITPQCSVWGGEVKMILPGDTARLRHYFQYERGSCSGENSKLERKEIGTSSSSGGEVEIAYYFIPVVNGRWVFWPEPLFGGEIKPRSIEASCSCSLGDILERMDENIRRLNFTAVEDFGKWQNGPLKVVFSKLYTRNGEYIYVECGKIDDLGLARILVVAGAKNVVAPYANPAAKKG
ncbi:MAG: hypothetical protein PWQ32_1640 [Thermococcaceae archaeon]|nr:hypothetical protein [Thermococcaceae archaeon]MDK2984254.1 hypothetical protein [Thermococcaceae archaeon]